MKARLSTTVLVSLVSIASASFADDAKPSPARQPQSTPGASQSPEEPSYAHGGQFHLRVDAVLGYKMLFRYDSSPRCSAYEPKPPSEQPKFCGYGSAPAVGVALGFAPIGSFEPYVFGRFGLGSDEDRTNMGKLMLVGAGARLYTMSDSAFKIFFSPWLGVDLTSGPVNASDPGDRALGLNSGSYRTDILVGLQVGPQYDISKWIGLYAAGGLSFGMLRYLGAVADLSIGVQVRAP